MRRSTEVTEAADVTSEILALARAMEERWFVNCVWIDWPMFFADLHGSVIPSTGRELDLGEDDSHAKSRIQRYIQKRRMAAIARWKFVANRSTDDDGAPHRTVELHVVDGSAR
ncbi:hypothetical protein [Pengzhenrongella frigida]|uniref:Uncharacterized protein n=1 Tax=Pengzhenrongella frigida TaxID=1259133 RepID=A0A4Q5N1Q4_9MICO|nr:hypothetical protein [Cellulomonas sp. HLT2-17]RYV49951.1 hypothetical protein EUA98_16080 [Cellulomonas sp. HLT2-17]